ncbi:hypothetical protein J437_LFUL017494 [Ladona fulva]|uniref:FZ domain-containing protein n=1 Tax=Ladona fulva TaxID=123851 RepID=A0A8K0KM21_LADFU|nr:hypothetical protein J437_LFUL017494 [Ladona fulva]
MGDFGQDEEHVALQSSLPSLLATYWTSRVTWAGDGGRLPNLCSRLRVAERLGPPPSPPLPAQTLTEWSWAGRDGSLDSSCIAIPPQKVRLGDPQGHGGKRGRISGGSAGDRERASTRCLTSPAPQIRQLKATPREGGGPPPPPPPPPRRDAPPPSKRLAPPPAKPTSWSPLYPARRGRASRRSAMGRPTSLALRAWGLPLLALAATWLGPWSGAASAPGPPTAAYFADWGALGGRPALPKCVDIPRNMTLCRDIGYLTMRLPNLLDHDTMVEVSQQAVSWVPLLNVRCHPDTQRFLCSLFSPVCVDRLIYPCRSLCEKVKLGCEGRMKMYGYPWPEMLKCGKFPLDNDMCIAPQYHTDPSNDRSRLDKGVIYQSCNETTWPRKEPVCRFFYYSRLDGGIRSTNKRHRGVGGRLKGQVAPPGAHPSSSAGGPIPRDGAAA